MTLFRLMLLLFFVAFIFCNCKHKNSNNQPISTFPISKITPERYDYDTSLWTDISFWDSTIILDIKYATTDNFVKEKMYACGRCFLRPPVAKLIIQAHQQLQKKGLQLKLFDCYRPKPIQEKLWQKVPNASYVTPPWKGSMHNRGVAIDLTIVDLDEKELDMGTSYDFFGKEAHHSFMNHSSTVKANRKLLKDLMESLELQPIRTEWWHYSYQKKGYEISEMQWTCPDK